MDKYERRADLSLKASFVTMGVALLSRPSTSKFWQRTSTVALGTTTLMIASYFHNFYKINYDKAYSDL